MFHPSGDRSFDGVERSVGSTDSPPRHAGAQARRPSPSPLPSPLPPSPSPSPLLSVGRRCNILAIRSRNMRRLRPCDLLKPTPVAVSSSTPLLSVSSFTLLLTVSSSTPLLSVSSSIPATAASSSDVGRRGKVSSTSPCPSSLVVVVVALYGGGLSDGEVIWTSVGKAPPALGLPLH